MKQLNNDSKQFCKVILDFSKESPFCHHGPMLLFERSSDGGKRFFACSAYRDRKLCSAFILESDWLQKGSKWRQNSLVENTLLSRSVVLNRIREDILPQKNVSFCHSCEEIFLPDGEEHKGHKISPFVTGKDFMPNPSQLFVPLDNSKKEAQYFFSENSIQTVIRFIENIQASHVLCLACPTIFERLQTISSVKSLMLDIDVRFRQFYTPKKFLLYNMFNHHFFDGPEGVSVFEQFLKESKNGLALVMDPPFGGKVEIISHTLKRIDSDYKRLNKRNDLEILKFWIFPYFMENQIISELPDFSMVDYKVEYRNHVHFQQGPKGRKQGSPIRIFTNVDLGRLELPSSEGYRYCNICKIWTSPENRHCNFCKSCTSKDGRTYVHCFQCNRCVKPTWKHCQKCNRCALTEHPCELFKNHSNGLVQSKKRNVATLRLSDITSTSGTWKVTKILE